MYLELGRELKGRYETERCSGEEGWYKQQHGREFSLAGAVNLALSNREYDLCIY